MSKPRERHYSIATVYGKVPVVGRCYGNRKVLAVRYVELAEPLFVVDHIPTGREVVKLEDQDSAVRFAQELDGLLGQTLGCSDPGRVLDSMPETIRDWIKRVVVGGYEPFEAHPVPY